MILIGKNALWSVFLTFYYNVKHGVCSRLYKIMMPKSFVANVLRFMSEVYARMCGVNHVFKVTDLYRECNFETCYIEVIINDSRIISNCFDGV